MLFSVEEHVYYLVGISHGNARLAFMNYGWKKGWEILEMRQLLQFLKDFSKKTVKKFGGFN